MPMTTRRSVARTAVVRGVGLHTGVPCTLRLGPAVPGSGIVFRRSDLPEAPTVTASLDRVRHTELRTTLAGEGTSVETVEHLLAAVAALEIDDLLVDLEGPEVPIGDGSAEPFVRALLGADPLDGTGEATVLRLPEPIEVRHGDAIYRALPADRLVLDVLVEWDHPLIGRQQGRWTVSPDVFAAELAPARTFGFVLDAPALQARGLARGASPDTVMALTDTDLLDGTLRWPDEFVRHKTVDLLGDLALAGGRLAAEISAVRPSHRGNLALARAIHRTATRKEQTQ
jgi:UDP-3-O-acyl N-acetylglucosamine deacetylase